jgi:hypothetical protein
MVQFARNNHHHDQANSIHLAVLKLSMEDYQVIKTTTGQGERASILIDKPFAGQESTVTKHGDKTFGSCIFKGCRVYWEIGENHANSE